MRKIENDLRRRNSGAVFFGLSCTRRIFVAPRICQFQRFSDDESGRRVHRIIIWKKSVESSVSPYSLLRSIIFIINDLGHFFCVFVFFRFVRLAMYKEKHQKRVTCMRYYFVSFFHYLFSMERRLFFLIGLHFSREEVSLKKL